MEKIKEVKIKSELSRELNLFHITMMGLGMMIGAGVFLGIGNSIYIAGPGGAVLTFALNGMIAMFTAMAYAELSSAIPRAGGAYNFARIGFGKGASFISGWMEWFASSVAGSVYAHTFSIYTLRYFEQLGLLGWLPVEMEWAVKLMSVVVALFFLYVNFRGAQETGKLGAFFTMGQTLFLVFIGLVGIFVVLRDPARLQNFKPFMPFGWHRLLITMGFTYVAFEGFEVISQAGDETINPRQNLPKAMLLSVFIVTLTYVAVTFATIVSVKEEMPEVTSPVWQWIGSHREKGFGEAVAHLLPMGNILLTLAVIFASTSALNATIYSASRVAYALGRDNMLPVFLSKISSKTKTPFVAIIFTGVIVLSIALFLPTVHVASSASIMFLFLFFLVNLSVIKIRWHMSDELKYGYIMPLFPLFPLLAVTAQIVLSVWLIHMSLIAWIVAPTWIAMGFVIYNLYSKKHAHVSPHDILIIEEVKAEVKRSEFKIMVAIANPETAIPMVRATYKLCANKNPVVELLHIVQIPEQVPLSDAPLYMMNGKEAIMEIMLYLSPIFPVSSTIRYSRNVARGIIYAAKEKKVNLLILGSPKGNSGHRYIFGSTIDPIVERVPSDVIVFRGIRDRIFNRVVILAVKGQGIDLVLDVGLTLVENKGVIDIYYIGNGNGSDGRLFLDKKIKGYIELIKDKNLTMNMIETDVQKFSDVCDNYDLLVIGIGRYLSRGIFKKSEKYRKLLNEVANKHDLSVAFVKESMPVGALIKKIL